MTTSQENKDKINSVSFEKALGDRYLSYALSTIMSRSLPDVRDGLKPVHRRLIYAMHQLKLNPNSPFKKSARVVGDVMGKFHPHGDAAIYGALVRLAQEFSLRYPLIDGQGNFGNIDGDNAAAMRYTEARLTDISSLMLMGLSQNAVDFKSTYDEESKEPLILPSRIPNLLANGSTGIAVGMATNIPPHNLEELCLACIHLIDNNNSAIEDLIKHIPGPDFPTGGTIVENQDTIKKIYEKGNGSIRLRAKYKVEELKNKAYRIIVYEIPYMVEKSKLIEKIASLMLDKKISLLNDIFDESSDDIRIIIEPKSKSIDPTLLMENLFKLTDLETRFFINLNALDKNNVPNVMSIKEMLTHFLDHRKTILLRETNFRLEEIKNRLEILEGYLIAYLNIDEVIKIIREEDDAKQELIKRYKLSDTQAEAILNMKLRSLKKLQEIEIKEEHKKLSEEAEEIEELLQKEKLQWKTIKTDLKAIIKKYGKNTLIGARKTDFDQPPKDIDISYEEVIEREDITLDLSEKNWIRTIKGHNVSGLRYKEGDQKRFSLNSTTINKLLLLATNGKCYTLSIDKIPRTRGGLSSGFGEPLRILIDLEPTEEILQVFPISTGSEEKIFLASSKNRGFMANATELFSGTKNGKQVFVLEKDEELKFVMKVNGNHLASLGENRKLLIFPVEQLPVLSRGKGQFIQKYKNGSLSDIKIFNIEDGLKLKRHGKSYVEKNLTPWIGKRNTAGRLVPIGFPRDNIFPKED